MTFWLVKRDGPCSKCGTILHVGEPAVWVRGANRLECIDCPIVAVPDIAPPLDRGTAGASATREHHRRAAKRETRLKEQWGDRIGGLISKVGEEPQHTRAWATGALGEQRLAAVLAATPGIEYLHDRRIRGSKVNIDHIVVAPAGIFVVDSKRYQGQIRIERKGAFFRPVDRLYVGRFDRTKEIDGMKWQVGAVEAALLASSVEPKPPITPVLCFIDGEWPWFGAAKSFDGVHLESERSIVKLFSSSADYAPGVIDRIARELARLFPPK
jgi:hypothetical protein